MNRNDALEIAIATGSVDATWVAYVEQVLSRSRNADHALFAEHEVSFYAGAAAAFRIIGTAALSQDVQAFADRLEQVSAELRGYNARAGKKSTAAPGVH